MSFVTWRLQKQSIDSNNDYSGSVTTLTEFSRPIVEVNSGDAKDTFSFTINNFNDEFNNYFQPQDKIIIARAYNTTVVTDDDIIIVGAVKDPPYNRTGSRNEIKIEGFNYSESIFSAIIPRLDARALTIPQAIQSGLNAIKGNNPNFRIQWHPSNPSLTTTDTAFPTVYKDYSNAPFNKFIEEVSSAPVTGDGRYYYYVDKDNYLVWRASTGGAIAGTFDSSTDDYKSIKSGKDTKGIVNYVIIKGGRDPSGNPIQRPYIDAVSTAKNGYKFYYVVDPGIQAETLVSQDMDKSDPTKKGAHTQRFPYSYNFTCSWLSSVDDSSATPTMSKGVAPVVTSNGEYTSVVRREIVARMDRYGNSTLAAYSKGKLKIDISFEAGSKAWGLLDQIQCTIPEVFSGTKVMRIRDIQFTDNTDVYGLEEDVGTI